MKKELRGTYITPVSFEMVYKYFWAWLTGRKVEAKEVLIQRNEI